MLLIRHAETTSNVSRAMDTAHPGADLTALGRRQAEELAAHLAEEEIDALYVSPRLRTRRTAQPLAAAHGLEPLPREGLCEVSAGEWEMSSDEAHRDAYAGVIQAWILGDATAQVPGGERLADVLARFDEVVEEVLATGDRRVALVSHGAVLRTWCGTRCAGLDLETMREQNLSNTAMIRLERAGDGWRVLEWDARPVLAADDESDPGVEEDES